MYYNSLYPQIYPATSVAGNVIENKEPPYDFNDNSPDKVEIITTYAQITEDPTTSAHITWMSEKEDGALRYKKKDTDNNYEVAVAESQPLLGMSGTFLHDVELGALSDGATYQFILENNVDDLKYFKTFPKIMPRGGVRMGIGSDIHFQSKGHEKYIEMNQHLQKYDIDMFTVIGDHVDCEGIVTLNNTQRWIRYFKMLEDTLYRENTYIPFFTVVGNHDVNPSYYNGNPSAPYMQQFFKTSKLDPIGENYGQVSIGDYLQLFALDTFLSADPRGPQRDWLIENINPEQDWVLPFMHISGLPSYRNPNSSHHVYVRDGFYDILWENGVRAIFDGHCHSQKTTHGIGFSKEEPAYDRNDPVNGWLTAGDYYISRDDDNGLYVFGDGGWGSNPKNGPHNPATTWYLDRNFAHPSSWTVGTSGVPHEDDGKQAGEEWEYVMLATIEKDNLNITLINPAGTEFYEKDVTK